MQLTSTGDIKPGHFKHPSYKQTLQPVQSLLIRSLLHHLLCLHPFVTTLHPRYLNVQTSFQRLDIRDELPLVFLFILVLSLVNIP